MIKLLRIEFKKILTYKVFWILFGLYFVFLASGLLLAEFILNSMVDDMNRHIPIPMPHIAIYYFPDIWQNMSFFASIRYVLILPAAVVIILITNEFTYRTIRQNIINGMSKAEFICSKLLIILLISIIMTLLLAIGSFIIGLSHSDEESIRMMFRKFSFIYGFFVMIFTLLVYAFFFGFMLRNTGLAIALFSLYTFIVEPIIYFFLRSPLVHENKIYPYLPVNAVLRVVEYPAISVFKKMMGITLQDHVSFLASLIPLGYATIMTGIVFYVTWRKDL